MPVVAYPDLEAALCGFLADLGYTGTRTPATLQQQLPFLRIRRTGGTDDGHTDAARVDVDVFATARDDVAVTGDVRVGGQPVAETVRQRLTVHGPIVIAATAGTVVVDRSELLAGPVELPWADPQIRFWTASYRLWSRRPWPPP